VSRAALRTGYTLVAAVLISLSWLGCTVDEGELTAPVELQPDASPQIGQTLLDLPVVAQDRLDAAIIAQEQLTDHVLTIPGVVGTAVGVTGNGVPVVKVYVTTRGISGVPGRTGGVPVVVEVTGEIFALQEVPRAPPPCPPRCPGGGGGGEEEPPPEDPNPTDRWDRPVPIGVSTGHPSITAGTIGARVTDDGGNVYALSNNHVYAASNSALINDAVIQPGDFDGGSSPADDIGTLSAFVEIKFDGTNNVIDAAIALSSTDDLDKATPSDGYGIPKSLTTTASINQRVIKYGRTTRQTKGRVDAINATVLVNYGLPGIARFVGQVIIRPGNFSAGGDSGSLIVVEKGGDKLKPVGLLYAGSSSITVANPIGAVLDAFGVTIDGD